MSFDNELKFEKALIEHLTTRCGWKPEVIKNPTEDDLILNWKNILYQNNKERDVLNDCELTTGEMRQILNQVSNLNPFKANQFINGKTVSIKRDNEKDKLHFGKQVSLKIYDRKEIAGGNSMYQIVEQPILTTNNDIYPKRRADIMLLINGMPLFHIELKKSDIPISQATNQIKKYMSNNCFTGIFSLIQVFVAMNPEEAIYFANPGGNGKFDEQFYFHWEDHDNNIINEWSEFASTFLHIPRAHEIIGYYTIADATDGILKVMRSYQIYAAEAIYNKVAKSNWTKSEQHGGYVWHTTGSGKTMTSFKSAELIASSKNADKVIFLIDRVELGEQSFDDYQNFAGNMINVEDTEDTNELISKLKSDDIENVLIVTSIQKMSRINNDSNISQTVLNKIRNKRIVFIIDECHRDQNGSMHQNIKKTFPQALYFGFTGTPDFTQDKTIEDEKDYGLTSRIFGNELHRYTITHGIRDKNVLSFDPYMVLTFSDKELREQVALREAGCSTAEEAMANDKTREIYMYYMNKTKDKCDMVEIEKHIPETQHNVLYSPHRAAVVKDIADNFMTRSVGKRMHAIFATSSIPEAIEYYLLFSETNLKVTAVFDPSDDNSNTSIEKMNGITDILTDYESMFGTKYNISEYASFKKDVCLRLAHKKQYKNLSKENQIDIVIVVNQLLTGFDSSYINTIYFDKVLKSKNLIQAISRTNRLYDEAIKPHGTIVWYRYPHTMKKNLYDAVEEYSGNRTEGIFVDRLSENIEYINQKYHEIENLFNSEGIVNFERNSDDESWKKKFSKLFNELNNYINSAKIQGFDFDIKEYKKDSEKGISNDVILELDEKTYLKLVVRYKELRHEGGGKESSDIPFDLKTNILEIQTDTIDDEYLNSKFTLYTKVVFEDKNEKEKILTDIYNSFSYLTMEEQKYAKQILIDIEEKKLVITDQNKTFRDYITEYKCKTKESIIENVALTFGLDVSKLEKLVERQPNENNI